MKIAFKNLISMKNYFTYLSIQDRYLLKSLLIIFSSDYKFNIFVISTRAAPEGYSEGKKIALWSRRGKTLLDSEAFADFLKNVDFDLVECLYDDQSSSAESKKRAKKAYDRTLKFVELFFSKEDSPKVNI
jgi:hypothetical protein